MCPPSRFLFVAGVLTGLLMGLGSPVRAQDAEDAPVRLVVEHDRAGVTIVPIYVCPDTAPPDTAAMRYELTVERTGASTSRSRQAGTVTLAPGRTDTLSTVRLNAQPGDRLHLHLVVRRGEQIVAKERRTETIEAPE